MIKLGAKVIIGTIGKIEREDGQIVRVQVMQDKKVLMIKTRKDFFGVGAWTTQGV